MLPFTMEQFFAVFARYNAVVWPMQPILLGLAAVALIFIYVRSAPSSRIVSWILAFYWAWMAIAYHFGQFAAINPAARVFGILFLIQAGLFAWCGARTSCLKFSSPLGYDAAIGWILVVYALLVYPILGALEGRAYMGSPTFGVPCPTTIFTFGLLWFARRPFPRYLLIVPIIWSAVGGSAAFALGVLEDLALIVAGVAGLVMLVAMPRTAAYRDV
jgi:succinate dehydrogenase hydrophobic anchor subunit